MRTAAGIVAMLLLSSCAGGDSGNTVMPGSRDGGDWVAFYQRDGDSGRSQYFYDPTRLRNDGDRVEARWKILGGDGTTTIYQIEVHCRRGTFTELGTRIVDSRGRERDVPGPDLLIDQSISPNSSTDVFRRRFCPPENP